MKKFRVSQMSLMLVLVLAIPATATETIEGVLSLTPVGEHSCLAVQIPTDGTGSISGVRWYHNDGAEPFERLLLLEGLPGQDPDLQDTGLVLEEITGESLGWGEVLFDTPITSSTGLIWAVFEIPAYSERTGEGSGGGPGLGYVLRSGRTNARLSANGIQWAPLREGYSLAVEAIAAPMGRGASSAASPLSELRKDVPEGWWTELVEGEEEGSGPAPEDAPALATLHRPLVVAPNPFNPRTTIGFYVEEAGTVQVEVFDLRGRMVWKPESRLYPAGSHRIVWGGADSSGRPVASGVYSIRVTTSRGVAQQRAALVR